MGGSPKIATAKHAKNIAHVYHSSKYTYYLSVLLKTSGIMVPMMTGHTTDVSQGCPIRSVLRGQKGILTWHRGNHDHEGGTPRARLNHCTSVLLTLAITPNVGNSGV